MWITPKLDWTRTDYYNFEDLNRVENNSEVVAGLVGYFIGLPSLSFLTDRSMKRIEFADSLNRIEGNQDVLRQRHTPFGWMHRTASSDAQKEPKKVEGKVEDVRLDEVDLWGNRNLLLNTNQQFDWVIEAFGVSIAKNSFGIDLYKDFKQLKGKDITLSYEVKTKNLLFGSTNPWLGVEKRIDYADGTYSFAINLGSKVVKQGSTDGWVKYSTTRIVDSKDIRSFGATTVLMRDAIGEVSLRNIKVEIGNKATPWQPAPEDNIPWYKPTKTIELSPINLSSLDQYESSIIEWEADTPDGTRVDVEYSFDEESWTAIQSGQSLPFRKGDWLTGKVLYLRQRLFTNDKSKTPVIQNFRYEINGYQTKVEWKANDPFDFKDARRLEHNLNLLYQHYKGNAEAVPICGAFICGEDVV